MIIGIMVLGIGFAITRYAEWMHQNFGSIGWAEAHFGSSGGSRLFYKLIGIFFIFIGIMLITNIFSTFAGWILSPLTELGQRSSI
ncbi:MAG: hypothetical protein COT39_01495 [Parcubacteria group bacterium CG08_land_8_20_14_0_20_48_21]|nr:MAG: hypothetical protein AUK21_03455 [Parcubacteria group bacterium CG2_30_48_51]PIS32993.1 MAG: hypothetical protein COT39_01495 [Parcubacteria group bacterium CG08_land_8_20_14_0_20_48_21]PIW79558.1 MAG: hypothetical protein COZ99_00480 [Parcubacteria group bacterium CG_4_8_14_3_um_filter_48_16]PIY77641.1 MAG: hypothetical protein COY83_04240 [Parcubacteria group bacterium CG_4_10_14_0_8_um_filter_48_154]PIZ77253.1 MAG: hypothetical protein COY03_03555 [bacterium CG_4_10_14_0_2_um_filter_